jgi:hypothetical protein
METTTIGIGNAQTWLHDPKFNHIKYVAIKTLVMLIENINISKGVVNGAIVIITSLDFNKDKIITSITIKIINTNRFMTLKRQTLQHKYTYEAYYYKTSFSIVLACAIMGHKAQGATIKSKVIIHIKNSFALGRAYVMLSRVTNCSNLFIQGVLKPLDFNCIYQYQFINTHKLQLYEHYHLCLNAINFHHLNHKIQKHFFKITKMFISNKDEVI